MNGLLILATVAVMLGGVVGGCCPYPAVPGALLTVNVTREDYKCHQDLHISCLYANNGRSYFNGIAFNVTAPGPVDRSQMLDEMAVYVKDVSVNTHMYLTLNCDRKQLLWSIYLKNGNKLYNNVICTRRIAGAEIINGF